MLHKKLYVITNQDDEMVSDYSIKSYSTLVAWTNCPELAYLFKQPSDALRVCRKLRSHGHALAISTFIETETQYLVGTEYCTMDSYPHFISGIGVSNVTP